VLKDGMSKAFGGDAKSGVKKISAGKPNRLPRSHPAWKNKGRIVGMVRHCPGCTVQALGANSKKVVKSFSVKPGGGAYELQWLKPGRYILLVKADGYEALDVHNLVVKAKSDLRIDLEF